MKNNDDGEGMCLMMAVSALCFLHQLSVQKVCVRICEGDGGWRRMMVDADR